MQDQYKIYLVYISLSILCILCIILVSIYSTGSQIADWILGIFSASIFMGMSLIIYRWEKEKKELRKMTIEMKDKLNKMKLNEELTKEPEDLSSKKQKEEEEELITEGLKVKTNFDQNISNFISSLHNMQTLENNIYLENYTEYKKKLKQNLDLQILATINTGNKEILTDIINNNIYITTINKYKDPDENLNNINELYEHFINMYTNNDDPELEELKADENLIHNLNKLKQVILSIENNASYKSRFDYLIQFIFHNDEKFNGTELKEPVWKLIISDNIRNTKYGQGESDGKIMQ